ncbi:MAG: alpha-L-fucosidase [Bacteroidia bacterium]|nr:alpha-L-fucosidase [Bacteroidia bacterium]
MKKNSCLILLITFSVSLFAQQNTNKPEREEWFMDLGFGMFIHWSLDSQLGAVISHSMVGADEVYLQKFINELPKTFNPKKFDPDEWAVLAKLAGMKYVVFTTKHHSGFCMWDTKTTSFNVMRTPFARDVVREIFDAFRKYDIAIGIYFSPDDLHYFYENNLPVTRAPKPLETPVGDKGMMDLNKSQLNELLTNYGKIDIVFFDGYPGGLNEYVWSIDPDIVVTRGEMETPEQTLPNQPLPGPWEACFTMGTDWQYKPTNDPHKTGTEIINMLIETRAKGGNLLLNVGPKPDGEIQIEQEALLREISLWNMANSESIHNIRPWAITQSDEMWFTQSKDGKTIYAFVQGGDNWKYGTRKELFFNNIKGTDNTRVSILGYDSQLIEYRPDVDAKIYFEIQPHGLKVSALNGQRFYTNNRWPNPIVLKIENAEYQK